MPKRVYLIELKKTKVLVEASSQEAAIRAATAPLVKSCTIPTPLETARLMRDGVATIGESLAPKEPKQEPQGEGVGNLGLQQADGDDNGGEPSEQS